MISPLHVATRGYLNSPLSVSVFGYLTINRRAEGGGSSGGGTVARRLVFATPSVRPPDALILIAASFAAFLDSD